MIPLRPEHSAALQEPLARAPARLRLRCQGLSNMIISSTARNARSRYGDTGDNRAGNTLRMEPDAAQNGKDVGTGWTRAARGKRVILFGDPGAIVDNFHT